MRLLSARLIVSLVIGITLVSLCTSYYQVLQQSRGLKKDLQRRAEVLGESLARNVERDLERDAQHTHTLQRTVQQFANREHLAGLAVYDTQGHPIAVTTSIQPLMATAPAISFPINPRPRTFCGSVSGSCCVRVVRTMVPPTSRSTAMGQADADRRADLCPVPTTRA